MVMSLGKLFLPVLLVITLISNAERGNLSPGFNIRAFHLDLRIQVMKMPALRAFALRLSKQGINTLVMEWEGTYPFIQDPLISNRFAYSRREIKEFIKYCQDLKIDVIPLQQSFGHVEYILRNNKYASLREDDKDFSQVCPTEVELNKTLFTRLFKDIVSLHPSPYFHIGCDETHLLGHCEKCKKRAAEIGVSRLYFDHIRMLCDIVISLGKRPVLWADIALNYPEYLHLLPKQTILVDWNYGWELNRFGSHEELVKSGYEIWGAASLRSSPDNYYLTRWKYHFNNINDFIPACRESGYKGIVMTSWSTSGVYTPIYESEDDLVDLTALRHVYPVSGFDILIEAYIKAIGEDSLNIDGFVTDYCLAKFGFDEKESRRFETALFTSPYTISDGIVNSSVKMTIENILDSAKMSSRTFYALTPKKNKLLFEHYRLMSDIRVYYLRYMKIEKDVNGEGVSRDNIPVFLAELKTLMNLEPLLNRRFSDLNNNILYPAAIKEENSLRNQKVHLLYNRLSGTR
jgi:hexosaminidase